MGAKVGPRVRDAPRPDRTIERMEETTQAKSEGSEEISEVVSTQPVSNGSRRIAVVAYACAPDEGSEPGTGWAWARLVSEIGDVWLVTLDDARAGRTQQAIEALGLSGHIRLVVVPFPRWWKGRLRGFEHLSYLAWMLGMPARVRALEVPFDLAWHVTFGNAWLASTAQDLAPQFVFGPVGGGVGTPWRIVPALGWRGATLEVGRAVARLIGRRLNPLSRSAWSHATLVLTQNPQTVQWLPRAVRPRAEFSTQVALEVAPRDNNDSLTGASRPPSDGREGLVVGRLLPWKGGALAIRALADLPDWRLVFVGEGPDRQRLDKLVQRLGLRERVEFTGLLPREVVLDRMRNGADIMLLPSLHDEGGWAVAEAVAIGLPVVCLDQGGPLALGGRGVSTTTPSRTARALARACLDATAQPAEPDDRRSRTADPKRCDACWLSAASSPVRRGRPTTPPMRSSREQPAMAYEAVLQSPPRGSPAELLRADWAQHRVERIHAPGGVGRRCGHVHYVVRRGPVPIRAGRE